MPPLCTLLSDFGTRDWYVGAMKGTLLRLAPGTSLVDLTHDVEPGDIASAGFVLAGAAPAFPAGTVHLAVVDPGVGTARRLLAASCGAHFFVAPDNGLLTRALAGVALGAPVEVRAVERPDLYLDAPGQTFHGRDRFAPIAAALLRGEPLASLGARIEDAVTVTIEERPTRDPIHGRVEGHIVYVDRYGNLVTDIPASWLQGRPLLAARSGPCKLPGLYSHYAELLPGVPALLVGSLGTLEIAVRDTSAAKATGLGCGDAVTIELEPSER